MGERKLNVVNNDQSELDDLRREIQSLRGETHDLRDDQKLWNAVVCGIVAGMGAIVGAMAMACK